VHISAYGPRGRTLTAKLGTGWLNFIGDVATGIRALHEMQAAWQAAGRVRSDLSATAFALGCVLAPGESCNSPRAMAQAGPRAAVVLLRAADEAIAGLPNATPPHPSVATTVRGYVDLARTFEPADAPYLSNHRGHLMFVKPEERPFVTAELIRTTSFTATEPELIDRIRSMRDAGYTQFTVQIVPGQEQAIEDWARVKRSMETTESARGAASGPDGGRG